MKGGKDSMRKMILLITGFSSSFLIFLLLMGNTVGPVKEVSATELTDDRIQCHVSQPEDHRQSDFILPGMVPGTDLRAEKIVCYEGEYWEDCSNDDVTDIAGLEIRNTGKRIISYAEVVLEKGNTQFTFSGSFIPPDHPVVLLESNRKRCPYRSFTYCWGSQILENKIWLKPDDIAVEYPSMGAVRITNLSGRKLHRVAFYYKNYLPESKIYVGGITRKKEIASLCPGETVTVFPDYYARGYSRILGFTEKSGPEIS